MIDPVLEHPAWAEIDRWFAELVSRLAGTPGRELALAAALASRQRRQGHICLDLRRVAGTSFPPDSGPDGPEAIRLPEFAAWSEALRRSQVVGRPGEFRPLILDDGHRLYLHRYWQYESQLAADIQRRAGRPAVFDAALLEEGLRRLFDERPGTDVNDGQRAAAAGAVRHNLCVISGGPGTGKTHTVASALALLLEQSREQPLRIALAAPTGKAAARLQESLERWRQSLPCDPAIRERLPRESFTLHRLLGGVPDAARFKHDAANPLPFDVVVIDEASMVDLAMMARVFAATPPGARLILLGDKDQLASVEAGAVLGDLCAGVAENASAPLAQCVVQLSRNYRFGAANGILALSRAVNDGDAEQALHLLRIGAQHGTDGIAATTLPSPGRLKDNLRERVVAGFGELVTTRDPASALRLISRFRILCAVRQGPFGVESVNRLVEEILFEEGLIPSRRRWYAGRPVLVTRNDYNLKLFNGDTGVLLPDPATGELRVWFAGADRVPRGVPPVRLPEHETVFTSTVHKSQGSEFEEVLFILPDRASPLLTRELLYTGATRASRRVELWFDETVFRGAVERRVERSSGLREALWGAASNRRRGASAFRA